VRKTEKGKKKEKKRKGDLRLVIDGEVGLGKDLDVGKRQGNSFGLPVSADVGDNSPAESFAALPCVGYHSAFGVGDGLAGILQRENKPKKVEKRKEKKKKGIKKRERGLYRQPRTERRERGK
jgi:hypothetical protein